MNITIWSDFVCPFCYIGATNLNAALADFEHSDDVTIEYKSFQLDPNAEYDPEVSYVEGLARDKGTTPEVMEQSFSQISEMAKEAGLEYNFETLKNGNTLDAHRVFQYANEQDKGVEFYERLYYAIFTEGELISDHKTITRLAGEVGLDTEEVTAILADEGRNKDAVNEDVTNAVQVGAQGVPFFVFNNKYSLSGAQPKEVFGQALTQIYNDTLEE